MSTQFRVWLWVLILVVAMLAHLGLAGTPFTLDEAQTSLAALAVSTPSIGIDSSLLFTSQVLDFALLGASESVARLLPALAGIVLVILPWFWRQLLGETGALVTAATLLVSPLTLYASRRADSTIIAVCAAALLATAVKQSVESRKGAKIWLTIGIAIALTSGALMWDIVIAAGVVLLVIRWQQKDVNANGVILADLKTPLLVGAALALALVTWAGFYAGWDGLMRGLASWWHSWQTETPRYGTLALLMMYEPALVIAGMTALLGAILPESRTRMTWALSLFTVVLALVLEIRPGVGSLDGAALVLPLSVLVGLTAQHWLAECPQPYHFWNRIYVIGALIFWLPAGVALTQHAFGTTIVAQPGIFVLVGVVILFALQILLGILAYMVIPMKWILRNALKGLIVFVLLLQVSYATNLAFLRGASAGEPVVDIGGSPDLLALVETLDSIAVQQSQRRDTLPIAIMANDRSQTDRWLPLVQWALRDFPETRLVDVIPSGYPGYVITQEQDKVSPSLAGRRGMRFTAATQYAYPVPACTTVFPPECVDLAGWILYRKPAQPPVQHNIILWAP